MNWRTVLKKHFFSSTGTYFTELDGDALPKLKLKISNKNPIRMPSSSLALPNGASFYKFPARQGMVVILK
jgi:hypothetical protein